MKDWTIQRWQPNKGSWVITHNVCLSDKTYHQKVYQGLSNDRCHACGAAPPEHLVAGMYLMNMNSHLWGRP